MVISLSQDHKLFSSLRGSRRRYRKQKQCEQNILQLMKILREWKTWLRLKNGCQINHETFENGKMNFSGQLETLKKYVWKLIQKCLLMIKNKGRRKFIFFDVQNMKISSFVSSLMMELGFFITIQKPNGSQRSSPRLKKVWMSKLKVMTFLICLSYAKELFIQNLFVRARLWTRHSVSENCHLRYAVWRKKSVASLLNSLPVHNALQIADFG